MNHATLPSAAHLAGAGEELLIAVVRPTPHQESTRPAPERVAAQRAASRAALREAARLAACPDTQFQKSGERGRPIPTASGWHWSISHDATFVAAVLSRRGPLGIDLERIALRRRLLVERVADTNERAELGETADHALDAFGFARLWTSKEAVLKAEQIGLPGLTECKLTGLDGEWRTRLTYRGEPRSVVHTRIGSHLVSLSSTAPFRRVLWDRPAES
ncbi:4'-phosphopantetheinyl transferase superfamily protein [Planctomycetes bacterium Poly30]|uniref:4'-phosphopantetheinyl transferase family protein n=1 Tax=Saltatorellus ferox TaxID=2528018 RepID=UPI00119D9CC6